MFLPRVLCVSEFAQDKQFLCYFLYSNPGNDGPLYDCLLDSMARVQSADDKVGFVFVGDANAHHAEWLESSLKLIGMGMMLLIFAICRPVKSW